MVPLKELQEAGLGASGTLDPPETQVVAGPLQVAHVHGQVLQPQTRPLSHRGQLGRPVGRAAFSQRRKRGSACKHNTFSIRGGKKKTGKDGAPGKLLQTRENKWGAPDETTPREAQL